MVFSFDWRRPVLRNEAVDSRFVENSVLPGISLVDRMHGCFTSFLYLDFMVPCMHAEAAVPHYRIEVVVG